MFDLMENESGLREKRIEGIVLGIVTNNQDKEGLGRVKIKLPWLGDSDESRWARVATLMAGKARGTFFLPEVGDEVVVAFDHGDINHPYILGSLWNSADKPPDDVRKDDKNNLRVLRSRSGHQILFDDNQEQQMGKIEIRTSSGHRILLDDSAGKEKIEIVDRTGDNSIKIDSAQNAITISCSEKLSIKAKAIELESDETFSIKTSAVLTIQGSLVKIN